MRAKLELAGGDTQSGTPLCLRKWLQGEESPRGVYVFVMKLVCWGLGLYYCGLEGEQLTNED